jgi:hypothetical protein
MAPGKFVSAAANGIRVAQCTYLDLVPVLTGEGVLRSLLETLLTLRKALVPVLSCQNIFDPTFHASIRSNRESAVYGATPCQKDRKE